MTNLEERKAKYLLSKERKKKYSQEYYLKNKERLKKKMREYKLSRKNNDANQRKKTKRRRCKEA